jgi:hypothetical protein
VPLDLPPTARSPVGTLTIYRLSLACVCCMMCMYLNTVAQNASAEDRSCRLMFGRLSTVCTNARRIGGCQASGLTCPWTAGSCVMDLDAPCGKGHACQVRTTTHLEDRFCGASQQPHLHTPPTPSSPLAPPTTAEDLRGGGAGGVVGSPGEGEPLTPSRALQKFQGHEKTVVALHVDEEGNRRVMGGLLG